MLLKIPYYQDAGLLLVRIGLGAVFIIHGWQKWQNLDGVTNFFTGLGIPGWMVYLVAATELVGGVAVLFGWLARFFSLGLVVIMVVAIISVNFKKGFVGGYEFDLVLLLMALAIALAGSGRYRLKIANWNNHQI
ncbi:MAG TPA: oxidoreductase [Candidatus Veblenbacteria bacterium]|uniref:Oxidoreductase n=2 Tax=Candidatus Vebleniibacteriota TaxID=1817921 RepID=A0A1G2Q6E4_9BACT|nr:MAG: YfiD [Parcubacteria group bacterium GW2011_GWD1_42_9]KKT21000.1 MAG: YfiD [Parcubacteria group bacterium GW2011_GWE1_43_8]OHA55153.1 MAG: hypothetical protein A2388_02860 [Candidatus Veblenbacteria bacterium RIFOXYB1_FULL_43_13]OHA56107.1 MAG: hypothetical protein A2588_01015 [Candidatus Veblenbacteria bacterium RIFOXYD1_FULL_43_11]HAO81415.1 oxidoreductase [Candidatus Veblenbacteria bacterium]